MGVGVLAVRLTNASLSRFSWKTLQNVCLFLLPLIAKTVSPECSLTSWHSK